MAAGDLITGIYQWELDAVLFGDTTATDIVAVKGYGPVVRAVSTPRTLEAGSVPGIDSAGPLDIEFDLEIWAPGDPTTAGATLVALAAAFAAHTADRDLVELHGWFPGVGRHKLYGRPMGLDFVITETLTRGFQPATARFTALDPIAVAVTEPTP